MSNIRKDFEWFNQNPNMVYLDSAATSLKPKQVILKTSEYINNDCTNPHNTDSLFSYKVYSVIEETRKLLAQYINGNYKEIIFTPSATFSLNMIADSLEEYLNANDEVLITNAEHASNILPWLKLKERKNIKLIFADSKIKNISPEEHDILNKITNRTKIVSFANGTNLIGTKIDAEKLSKLIKEKKSDVIVIVDATQYLSHSKMDVKNSSIDVVVGSAHKMFGPTGIGFMYVKESLLNKINSQVVGGGMNHVITRDHFEPNDGFSKFEAGTPNVTGIYGWNAALKYYNQLDLCNLKDNIYKLKKYLDDNLSEIKGIKIYNKGIDSFITIFSYENVFSQDLAGFLGSKNIIVRSGLSCAKLTYEIINYEHVVRVSMHFYTTKEDIDKLLNVLKNYKKGDEIDAII